MSKSNDHIVIPETFPSILKTYAKGVFNAINFNFSREKCYKFPENCVQLNIKLFQISIDAMRTQPYDILSWSAAYFRCIADDIQPPTKIRFEENTDRMITTRCLTEEYLKVLVKQVNLN